jgi:hypothetical protein
MYTIFKQCYTTIKKTYLSGKILVRIAMLAQITNAINASDIEKLATVCAVAFLSAIALAKVEAKEYE